MDQNFYFCQGDLVQYSPTWCNILKVQCFPDPIIWMQRMTTKSQIRGTIPASLDTWWRLLVPVCPDTGYIPHFQLLETLSSFWKPKWCNPEADWACLKGGLCCGGSVHRNTLIPFWLNSCKFWLHALTCGQRETTFAIRAVLISRKYIQQWHLGLAGGTFFWHSHHQVWR